MLLRISIRFSIPCSCTEPFIFTFVHFLHWSFRSLAVGSNGAFIPVRIGCDAGTAVVVSPGPIQLSDYLRCRFGVAN